MKKIIFGLIALGIIAGTLMFISCNYKRKCNWKISATEEITFNLMDETVGYTVNIKERKTEINFIEYASQKANEQVFQYLKNYCASKGLVFDDKTIAFVIYYDKHISKSLSVTDEHIKGISAYTLEGNKIMHHLYLRDEYSNFSEIKNVNVAVPFVTLNHIFFYLENYVFTDVQNVSAIDVGGDFAIEISKNIKKYERTPMQFEKSVRLRGPNDIHLTK